MPTEPPFREPDLEGLGHCPESAASHRELDSLFRDAGLQEPTPADGMPKWMRIKYAIAHGQNQTQTGNLAMKFIQTILAPRRFVHDPNKFEEHRARVNHALAFRGWQLRSDGKFEKIEAAATIEEAQARADRLRAELVRRKVHPDVLQFCKAELVQHNYFHAALEATKSVSDKLRKLTGLTGNAGSLATQALMPGKSGVPKVAFNSLLTDTDLSEQKGLANLFVGMFGTFRNTTAHGPKISWPISEDDALDLLTMVSFLHRRLDVARVDLGKPPP
jgi:uncharacterized protein (TIGR02391 family)